MYVVNIMVYFKLYSHNQTDKMMTFTFLPFFFIVPNHTQCKLALLLETNHFLRLKSIVVGRTL